jgi:hypothetical protein
MPGRNHLLKGDFGFYRIGVVEGQGRVNHVAAVGVAWFDGEGNWGAHQSIKRDDGEDHLPSDDQRGSYEVNVDGRFDLFDRDRVRIATGVIVREDEYYLLPVRRPMSAMVLVAKKAVVQREHAEPPLPEPPPPERPGGHPPRHID